MLAMYGGCSQPIHRFTTAAALIVQGLALRQASNPQSNPVGPGPTRLQIGSRSAHGIEVAAVVGGVKATQSAEINIF